MTFKTIGIMANATKETAVEVARVAQDFLRERGVKVLLQHHMAGVLGVPERGMSDADVTDADAVLVLGGDGTILATSRECAPKGSPLLPVHLVRFCFLTEFAPDDLTRSLSSLLDGNYTIGERMMLWGVASRMVEDDDQSTVFALNDIVVANGPLSRVLHLRMMVNDKYVTTYAADGIILSTPTGSTAYSLSAGGPLVAPSLQVLLVTPICPHTLTSRALIIPADDTITVVVDRDPEDIVRVTVDGQLGFALQPGDEIRVRRSPTPARVISVGGADFFDKLQTKLRWGDRLVY
jgi:NAD+ kinase